MENQMEGRFYLFFTLKGGLVDKQMWKNGKQ